MDEEQTSGFFKKLFRSKQDNIQKDAIRNPEKYRDKWDTEPRTTPKQLQTAIDLEKQRHETRNEQLGSVELEKKKPSFLRRHAGKIALGAGGAGLAYAHARNKQKTYQLNYSY